MFFSYGLIDFEFLHQKGFLFRRKEVGKTKTVPRNADN